MHNITPYASLIGGLMIGLSTGLIVGVETRMGSGVYQRSRGLRHSTFFTSAFSDHHHVIAIGALTVYVLKHALGVTR